MVSQARQVGPFEVIEAGGGLRVEARLGEPTSVTVTAEEAVVDLILTDVIGDTLHIGSEQYSSSEPVVVSVVTPRLTAIALSGGCSGSLTGVAAESLDIDLSGASQLAADGSIDELALEASGGSQADLRQLSARRVSADLSGGSQANVIAHESVVGEASGGSLLTVLGEAEVDVEVSGGSLVS
jgi:hypothetical protein